jgi:hypothetical protein
VGVRHDTWRGEGVRSGGSGQRPCDAQGRGDSDVALTKEGDIAGDHTGGRGVHGLQLVVATGMAWGG